MPSKTAKTATKKTLAKKPPKNIARGAPKKKKLALTAWAKRQAG